MNQTEPTWWNAFHAGDLTAFARLIETYQQDVRAIAYAVLLDDALAEDVAQETFITAWTRRAQLRDPAALGGWLVAIARNRGRDLLRARRREVLVDEPAEIAAEASSPQLRLEREALRASCRTVLARVPERYREVLVLYYSQERPVVTIAKTLGITEAAAMQRLSRGRRFVARYGGDLADFVGAKQRSLVIAVLALLALRRSAEAAIPRPRSTSWLVGVGCAFATFASDGVASPIAAHPSLAIIDPDDTTLAIDPAGAPLHGKLAIDGATSLRTGLAIDNASSLRTGLAIDDVAFPLRTGLAIDGATSLRTGLAIDGATSLRTGLAIDGATSLRTRLAIDDAAFPLRTGLAIDDAGFPLRTGLAIDDVAFPLRTRLAIVDPFDDATSPLRTTLAIVDPFDDVLSRTTRSIDDVATPPRTTRSIDAAASPPRTKLAVVDPFAEPTRVATVVAPDVAPPTPPPPSRPPLELINGLIETAGLPRRGDISFDFVGFAMMLRAGITDHVAVHAGMIPMDTDTGTGAANVGTAFGGGIKLGGPLTDNVHLAVFAEAANEFNAKALKPRDGWIARSYASLTLRYGRHHTTLFGGVTTGNDGTNRYRSPIGGFSTLLGWDDKLAFVLEHQYIDDPIAVKETTVLAVRFRGHDVKPTLLGIDRFRIDVGALFLDRGDGDDSVLPWLQAGLGW